MSEPLLYSVWRDTCARDPGARVLQGTRTWTRRELEAAAQAEAAGLQEGSTLRGRRVVLAEKRGELWLVQFLALVRLGAIPVLMDASDAEERLVEGAKALRAVGGFFNGVWRIWADVRARREPEAALVKVTSGSTGVPKGLAFRAEEMLGDGTQVMDVMGITEKDVNYGIIPLGHAYGLGNLVMPLLQKGVPLVVGSVPLPHAIGDEVERSGATVFPLVPSLARALGNSDLEASKLASVRLVISAGAPIEPAVAVRFRERFGQAIHTLYGSSETGSIAYDREGIWAERGGGVMGKPLRDVRVTVSRLARLRVRGPAVLRGREVLLGDRVEILDTGELRLLGRVGRMVKLGGRRLDLAGLEAELAKVPGVAEVAVETHPESPDKLAALVVTALERKALKQALLERVPAWKVPERLRLVEALPRTARGKVNRAAVRSLLRET